MTKRYLYFIIHILLGVTVYFISVFNGFVWDDQEQIVTNPTLHSLTNIAGFFRGGTFNSGGAEVMTGNFYRPLLSAYFAFIYTISAGNPGAYHAVQLMLHISNSIIAYLILLAFVAPIGALGLSIIFLVHPINAESVLYISNAQEPLFFFFGSLALLICIHRKSRYLIFLLLLVSLLFKETGFVFLIAVIAYQILNQRFKTIDAVLTFIVMTIYLGMRFGLGHITRPITVPIAQLNFIERAINIPRILSYYATTVIFPYNLSIAHYDVVRHISVESFYIPLGVAVVLIASIVWSSIYVNKHASKNIRNYLLFLIIFIVSLGLHLQIIPLDATYADRWFYVPIFALLGMLGVTASSLPLGESSKKYLAYVVVILIVLYSIRSYIRTLDWKDNMTLYSHDEPLNTRSYMLESNYGVALSESGDQEGARIHYLKSVELYSNDPIPYLNLGNYYSRRNDYKTAYDYYLHARSISDDSHIYEKLATATLLYKDPEEAKKLALEGLDKYPGNHALWIVLAISHHKLGNDGDARSAISSYKNLPPDPVNQQLYDSILRQTFKNQL